MNIQMDKKRNKEINKYTFFLAAMSSSRSDVVTQSVRSSFRTLFFLLVSWEFYLVLKSFNGVSRKS